MSISGFLQIGPKSASLDFEAGPVNFELSFGGGKDEKTGSSDAPSKSSAPARTSTPARTSDSGSSNDTTAQQFLDDVKAVKTSSSKFALIENYVEDAVGKDSGSEKKTPELKAQPAADKTDPVKAGPAKAGPAKAGPESAAKAGPAKSAGPQTDDKSGLQPLLTGLSDLAKAVDGSELPEGTQNALLDDIAGLITKLEGVKADGGNLREAALLGVADIARTLDRSAGSDAAKDPIFNQIADQLTQIAVGEGASSAPGSSSPAQPVSSTPSDSSPEVPAGEESGPWTHSVKDGKAEIKLGDKYTITAQEDGEAWTVKNNETGAVTRVWGDPHVDVGNDGKTDWDFKKDMTFQLDDGTKITVNTVPADNGTTYSSELVITNGDKAMRVTGLAGDRDGKDNLEVVQMDEGGQAIDDFFLDGFTVEEEGNGWETADGSTVNQKTINTAEKAS